MMTRADIASYLSLAMETVSRVLTRLQESGVIEVERNRRVYILEPDAMEKFVGTPAASASLWSGAGLRREAEHSGAPFESRGTFSRRTAALR